MLFIRFHLISAYNTGCYFSHTVLHCSLGFEVILTINLNDNTIVLWKASNDDEKHSALWTDSCYSISTFLDYNWFSNPYEMFNPKLRKALILLIACSTVAFFWTTNHGVRDCSSSIFEYKADDVCLVSTESHDKF